MTKAEEIMKGCGREGDGEIDHIENVCGKNNHLCPFCTQIQQTMLECYEAELKEWKRLGGNEKDGYYSIHIMVENIKRERISFLQSEIKKLKEKTNEMLYL